MRNFHELGDLDLNLLLAFDQLIKKRSVSIAAEAMDVSQPAISNALKRLREIFEDKLFVRGPRGMEPTSRAQQLAEPIAYALDTIKQAVIYQNDFDPCVEDRNFSLLLAEFDCCFLPPLVSAVEQENAKISFTFTGRGNLSIKEDMEYGNIDLAFGSFPHLESNFYKRRLFRDRIVLTMRKGHPLSMKRKVRIGDLEGVGYISVCSAGEGGSELDQILEGIHSTSRVKVDSWLMLGPVLQCSDMLAAIPERMAKRLAVPFELDYRMHPVDLPYRSLEMYWHERVHRDPAVRWLRGLILDLFGEGEDR